jgi:hypothetical protein
MKRAIKSGLLVSVMALLLAWPMQGSAQSRRAAGFGISQTTVRTFPSGRTAGRIGTPLNPNFSPIQGTPGPGFDYEHLAIVNPSEPFREDHRFPRSGFEEILPLAYFPESVPFYSQPQPIVIVLEQPPQTVIVPSPSSSAQAPPGNPAPPATIEAAPEAPLPELGQFILVRRDGKVLLAVGFTIRGDRIIYITREGARLSFPLSDLDVQATRQRNDVNGTNLALPN